MRDDDDPSRGFPFSPILQDAVRGGVIAQPGRAGTGRRQARGRGREGGRGWCGAKEHKITLTGIQGLCCSQTIGTAKQVTNEIRLGTSGYK